MKKLLLFLIDFFTFLHSAVSQDTLYDVKGKVYIGKLIYDEGRNIQFQSGDRMYVFKVNEVGLIKHPNGEQRYNWDRYRQYTDTHIKVNEFKKNSVAVNLIDFAFVNLTISYERILKSGNISIQIPLSMGLGGKPSTEEYTTRLENTTALQNKNYSSGVELNYYPSGQTRHHFYVGLSALVGSFNYYSNVYDTTYYVGYNNVVYPRTTIVDHLKHSAMQYAGMIHLGGNLGVTKNFMLGARFGLGFKQDETIFEDYTRPKAEFAMLMAYKF